MKRILLVTLMFACMSAFTAGPAKALKDFYSTDFKGWRDSKTNSDFKARLKRSGKKAIIIVPRKSKFGKVMSPVEGIQMTVTPSLYLQIKVDKISEGSALNVEIVNAGPPYDGHKVLKGISKPGTYSAKISAATDWDGKKKFWLAIWLEGNGKIATVSSLKVGENIARATSNEAARSKKKKKKVAPAKSGGWLAKAQDKFSQVDFRGNTSSTYKYFENWSAGLNGWRDGSKEKGFDTVAAPKNGGRLKLTLKDKASYGKLMSPKKPIVVDFATHPFLEIELERELERGKVKVQLVQARNQKNYHTVIPSLSRPGVYIANIPEVAGWKEKEAFFIVIWLEGKGGELNISSLGFSNRMSTLQGVMTPIQSVKALELAPSKDVTIIKVSGVADQAYRGQSLEGYLSKKKPDDSGEYYDYLGRIGNIDVGTVGYSEISQKMYLIASINPNKHTGIYAALGYDMVNAIEGLTWEDAFGKAINPKIDYGLIQYHDFYAGNVMQIGSVYDPLFTDQTLKKASTFRGFLWKPTFNDWKIKVFGTRAYTEGDTYKNNTFLTGARFSRNIISDNINLRVGLSGVNLSKSNGNIGNDFLQGSVDPSEYQTFVPSVYLRIKNNSPYTMYYNDAHNNVVTLNGTNNLGEPASITVDLNPVLEKAGTANYVVADSVRSYYDNGARGLNKYGWIDIKIPLRIDQATYLVPDQLTTMSAQFQIVSTHPSAATIATDESVGFSFSSDGVNWRDTWNSKNEANFDATGFIVDGLMPTQESTEAVTWLKTQTFATNYDTLGRSVVGLDVRGQILGVNIEAEYNASFGHSQYFTGERFTTNANAYFLKLSRGFSGAMVKAALFNYDPDYSTGLGNYNMVDDNDNKTLQPDLYVEKAGVIFGDYFNRGIPDKEYVIGLYVPQDYTFHEREDQNHNGVLDSRENDHIPDYEFRTDQKGLKLSAAIPAQVLAGLHMQNMEILANIQYVERISEPGSNQTFDLSLNYNKTDIEDWDIAAGLYVARMKDNLSNQYSLYDEDDNEFTLENNYTDNFVVTPEVKVQYDAPWGLKATVLDRFRTNMEFDGEKKTLIGNEVVLDVRYKHYLYQSFAIQPCYVTRIGTTKALADAPIHNTYYLPYYYDKSNDYDLPISHSFYLKTSVTIMSEYKLAFDLGREIDLFSKQGQPWRIWDKMGVGLQRDISRGYLRIQYEMDKVYHAYQNELNWGRGALWAQLTVSF